MTQEEVGDHLGLSRSAIAQMEHGNRTVGGLELSRLAYQYARDLRSFVAPESPVDEGGLAVLSSLHPDLAVEEGSRETVRRCAEFLRELTNLERLLGLNSAGQGDEIAALLRLPEPDHQMLCNHSTRRFLGLALEAFRRDEISRAKLVELAGLVGLSSAALAGTIEPLGLGEDEPAGVRLPEE